MSFIYSPQSFSEIEAGKALFAIAQPEKMQALSEVRTRILELEYEINPPATVRDLAAFESFFGVRLPLEYRMFLCVVGNGINESFGDTVETVVAGIPTVDEIASAEWHRARERLQVPFPLEQDSDCFLNYQDVEVTDEDRKQSSALDDGKIRDEKFQVLWDQKEAEFHQQLCLGSWELRHGSVIVMSSLHYGTVWHTECDFYEENYAACGLAEVVGFLDWLIDGSQEWI